MFSIIIISDTSMRSVHGAVDAGSNPGWLTDYLVEIKEGLEIFQTPWVHGTMM